MEEIFEVWFVWIFDYAFVFVFEEIGFANKSLFGESWKLKANRFSLV